MYRVLKLPMKKELSVLRFQRKLACFPIFSVGGVTLVGRSIARRRKEQLHRIFYSFFSLLLVQKSHAKLVYEVALKSQAGFDE